jgi:hypothetical protein
MRVALHALLLFLGLSALISGALLIMNPLDGGPVRAPLNLLERTPFTDFFFPGLILGGLFGLGSLLASLAVACGSSYAFRLAQIIGAGQVIWILFQLMWFPETSALQPVMAGIGVSIFVLAGLLNRTAIAK